MRIKKIMFLFCFLLVIFFINSLNSTSYALAENINDGETITLEIYDDPVRTLKINQSIYDNYKYVLILTGKSSENPSYFTTYVVFSNYELYFDPLNGRVYGTGLTYFVDIDIEHQNFIDISNYTITDFSRTCVDITAQDPPYCFIASGLLNYKNHVVCHSKTNIYAYNKNDGKGDLVFQVAPLEVGLTQMMSSINFLEVLTEFIQILPIILVMLIGIVSLRKTINLLLQVFRKV